MNIDMADTFHIRLATLYDADIIAWHRARMFQDMGDLQPHLFEAFQMKSCERLRDVIARGEYVGWLTTLKVAPATVIAGAGVHLRRVLPHPAKNRPTFAEGRHGIVVNVF